MQLERISVQLRRRSGWEAIDLGQAMLRAWAAPAYRTWFATYWLTGIILMLILWRWPMWAMLALWWLKPLFDRILLFTYSRSLFGTPTRVIDVWRALPGILQQPGVLSGLTIRRLSLCRSYFLPVWQLENQSGAAARERFKVLGRRNRGNAIWLIFVCAHMSAALAFSIYLLIQIFTPVGVDGIFSLRDFISGDPQPFWKECLGSLIGMTAETLIEPLYVASGFSLYINRRSDLEGWDIDIALRRMAARIGSGVGRGASAIAAVVLALGFLLGSPAPAVAAPSQSSAKTAIKEVLADPVFGKEVEEKRWKRREQEEKDEKQADWIKTLLRALEFLGEVLRSLVWIGAALLVAFILYLALRYSDRWWPGRRAKAEAPDFLFGLDVRPQSLPADVAGAARAALAAGHIEEGLSLLYRGALVALIHHLQVEFKAGDTEADCLRRADRHLDPPTQDYFGQLVSAWGSTAYAHRPPPLPSLDALCSGWERHFGAWEVRT